MNSKEIFICCIVVSIGLFLFSLVKDKKTFFLKCLCRGVVGVFAICFVNSIFTSVKIPLNLGVNFYTISTTAILGFPGLTMLYGILGCQIL